MKNEFRIKGFDKDLCCRGVQFEIGNEYNTGADPNNLKLCSDTVYHYGKSLQQVNEFYDCNIKPNRYCIIEVLGNEISDDSKCGSNHIKIVREVVDEELGALKGLVNANTGLFNTGYRNTGDCNAGDCNAGDRNAGDRNTGLFNKTNYSNGIFCTMEPKICIFNIQTDLTLHEFKNSKYYCAIFSSDFILTQWDSVRDKLIVYTYEEACEKWWDNMNSKNKEIIKSIPNFDIDIFCEITGIDREKI